MKDERLIKIKSYSPIKPLAVILAVGLILFFSAARLNINRMNGRDAVRAGDIAAIKSALAAYLKDSATGYPASTGECLTAGSGVGRELIDSKALSAVPSDPLWPTAAPAEITKGSPDPGQSDFCYFYYSGASDQFKVSFFLESNSKAGQSGSHFITQ